MSDLAGRYCFRADEDAAERGGNDGQTGDAHGEEKLDLADGVDGIEELG